MLFLSFDLPAVGRPGSSSKDGQPTYINSVAAVSFMLGAVNLTAMGRRCVPFSVWTPQPIASRSGGFAVQPTVLGFVNLNTCLSYNFVIARSVA